MPQETGGTVIKKEVSIEQFIRKWECNTNTLRYGTWY